MEDVDKVGLKAYEAAINTLTHLFGGQPLTVSADADFGGKDNLVTRGSRDCPPDNGFGPISFGGVDEIDPEGEGFVDYLFSIGFGASGGGSQTTMAAAAEAHGR